MSEHKRKVPYCALPWQQMIIDANGNVGCCGGLGNTLSLGNLHKKSIEAVWNGPEYRALRRKLAAGDMEGAGCGGCAAKQWGVMPEFVKSPEPEGGYVDCDYKKNINILEQEYTEGKDILKGKPTIISYSGTYDCNLDCVMCYQYHTKNRLKFEQEYLPKKRFEELFKLSKYFTQLIWGGGEPFHQKDCRDFLKKFDKSINPYLGFFVTTNGMLLNESLIEDLKSFYNVYLNFSIDAGSKEAYEGIRLHANWEKLMENVLRAAAVRDERKNWQIGWNFTVMKTNVGEMPKALDIVMEHGIPITFNPVIDHPMHLRIDLFSNYSKETEGWEEIFAEAKAKAEAFVHLGTSDRRSNCTKQIEYIYNKFKDAEPKGERVLFSGKVVGLEDKCLKYDDAHLRFFSTAKGAHKGYACINADGTFSAELEEDNYMVEIVKNRFEKFSSLFYSSSWNLSKNTNERVITLVRQNYPTSVYYCLDYSGTDYPICEKYRKYDKMFGKFFDIYLKSKSAQTFVSEKCLPPTINVYVDIEE